MSSTRILLGVLSLTAAVSGLYTSCDHYTAENFFDQESGFSFYSGTDPTDGFVSYVNETVANSSSLAGFVDPSAANSSRQIYLGVDTKTLNPAPGRESVRLVSQKNYSGDFLFFADLQHVPGGQCGTWPALWISDLVTWPTNGEIDIIEGVNSQKTDQITLHTSPGCTMSSVGSLAGSTLLNGDCGAGNGDEGCSITTASTSGYGAGFNAVGGGVYAMQKQNTSIQIWFWERSAIPQTITAANESTSPDPSLFGTPTASFTPTGSGCDIGQRFTAQQIIFNIDFCGQWAGEVWANDTTCSQLAPTCQEYVAQNPSAFEEAYFLINKLAVYEDFVNETDSSYSK